MTDNDDEKRDLRILYDNFMSEAATNMLSMDEVGKELAAHSLVRAQAAAVRYFQRFGALVAPDAFPGTGTDGDERDRSAKPPNTPAAELSNLEQSLYDFLQDRYPEYRSHWSGFLNDGTILAAVP
ncbi:hypothetical protein ELI13_34250 [Rhizobium ruizarguesonis]|uniref:Uncharacterized protein n=1 Tax=Rhizobium ruizarguesonis TaxID=2081791 RepID=A0ABY1WWE5_9HYPH|nr:hypothetical protein [Rhizobium ruizarguesonis]TAU13275.1 hypothetical protein ELI48_36990 [Rhizobium ruizarguesonis]TAU60889.1 hypothetical protein ELI46_34395 [Rhizobium ruizarguesonis]TAU70296.1 hypothetical protein ELI45_21910 [Rhizobium ruizarguesonis]TAV01861.1 hypothetical protein ELI34_37970 [Rhizobium ruizarguesonis]TAV19500.1 hypothetical protein ELI36_36860 [Rhizobium ruizarguesonis]